MKLFGLKVPTQATLVLSVAAGVVAYLNQTTFGFVEPWHTLLTAGLTMLAGVGISPVLHGALGNALHVSYAKGLLLASGLSTAAVGIATVSMDATLRSLIVGALTVVAGALVGPSPTPAPPAPPAPPAKTTT